MILPHEQEVTETLQKLDSDRGQLLPTQTISNSKTQIVKQTKLRLLITYEIFKYEIFKMFLF